MVMNKLQLLFGTVFVIHVYSCYFEKARLKSNVCDTPNGKKELKDAQNLQIESAKRTVIRKIFTLK